MLESVQIQEVLFIDIETVSTQEYLADLPPRLQHLWRKKARGILRLPKEEPLEDSMAELTYQDRAGIYAEFGKIACISVGFIKVDRQVKTRQLRIRSFALQDSEKKLLEEFADLVNQYFADPEEFWVCGHNIKEFDIPFICRRMVINKVELPALFNISGKKPWETKHLLDTMQLWKFGDVKNFTSLELLAAIFDIPTPKDDIDGSAVGRVFWKDDDLARICQYCEKDVLTVAQVFLFLKDVELLTAAEVFIAGAEDE